VVAPLVASILPLSLVRLGVDPALASGPVATVLRDILSVAVYLTIATIFLRR
jgi:magnesium transporter